MSIDRRTFLATIGAATLAGPRLLEGMAPRRPRPSASQLLWQRDELAMFLHFGINTFTDREWGDGREDPALFNPTALDVGQWARVARETGFKAMILTAKHHDGFCLWPTCTTRHSVASSPWKEGKGDLVREFVDACRAEGLRVGLYCSPWEDPYPPRLSLRKVVFPIRCAVDVLPSEFDVYVDDPMRWDVERKPSEQEV